MTAKINSFSPSIEYGNDEPFYATTLHTAEDIICEGSDAEADPTDIAEKHDRYEHIAERTLQGHLPVLQSARLKGPLYKDRKSEWINPWRHREPDWWKPGSKEMMFTRGNVMARAKQHGRKDMAPKEALAWCKRDARRQAQEMGMDADLNSDDSSSFDRSSEGIVIDETIHEESVRREEEVPLSALSPMPEGPESFPTSYTDNKEGRPSDVWTKAKRPADEHWLKRSHSLKRPKYDQQTDLSPSPYPTAVNMKVHQQSTSISNLSHNVQPARLLPSPKELLKTPVRDVDDIRWQQSQNYTQRTDQTRGTGKSTPVTIELQRHRFSDLEHQRQPSNSFEYSYETSSPYEMHNSSHQSTAISQSQLPRLSQASALPVHPRLHAINNNGHRTPGNLSFITDMAPSSGNLEHFDFRKKRRPATDSPKAIGYPPIAMNEHTQMSFSGSSKPVSESERGGMPSSITRNIAENFQPQSSTQNREPLVSYGSFGSDRNDGSWLSTQESIHSTPSVSSATRRIAVKDLLSPEDEDGDTSWVTTQNNSSYGPTSPYMNRTFQGSHSSNASRSILTVEHQLSRSMEEKRNGIPTSSFQSPSPMKNHSFSSQPSQNILPRPSPHLPAFHNEQNNLIVPGPSDVFETSSTQSYNSSPVSLRNSRSHTYVAPTTLHPPRAGQSSLENQVAAHTVEAHHEKGALASSPLSMQSFDHNARLETKEDTPRKIDSGRDEILGSKLKSPVGRRTKGDLEPQSGSEVLPSINGLVRKEFHEPKKGDYSSSNGNPSSTGKKSSVNRLHNRTPAPISSKPGAQRNSPGIGKSQSGLALESSDTPVRKSEKQKTPVGIQSGAKNSAKSPDSRAIVKTPAENAPAAETPSLELALAPHEQEHIKKHSPQSPWARTEIKPILAPVVIETTELNDALSSPHSGWQKEELVAATDSDAIRPFRDLMTPSPPPEQNDIPKNEQRPSNTQLLVDAAIKNPWASSSTTKSKNCKKRVSFGILDEEEPTDSPTAPSSAQRRQSSPPPRISSSVLREEDKFDDEVTNLDRFRKHFSTVSKYRPMLSGVRSLIQSSPAVDAMAEAFIAADRDTSYEAKRRLTSSESPSCSRNTKDKPFSTFKDHEDGDVDGDVDGDDSLHREPAKQASFTTALSETSSNKKLGDFAQEDYLDELGSFLGDWSVEGELKKVEDANTPKQNDNDDARRRLLDFENVWT
ncbi:protamine p1 protein [Rutstroemia sp. NJR-2017a BVV2]|nr:protamine p1 protein [Rutstroemia sp. NJR-2017a BVV2]